MIKLVGQKNCSRCEIIKNILTQNNVDYEYVLIDEIDKDIKTKYINMAKETGNLRMPLIIKDEQFVDLKEVI